jgi:hypothetical protein
VVPPVGGGEFEDPVGVVVVVGYPTVGVGTGVAQDAAGQWVGAALGFGDPQPVAVDQIDDDVGEPQDELPLGLVVEVGRGEGG